MTINAVKLANHLSSDSFNLHKSIKKNESYNEVAPMGKPFPRILRISRFSETWLLTYLALVVPTVSAKPIFDTIDSFTFTREYVLNSRGKVSNVKVSNITRSYHIWLICRIPTVKLKIRENHFWNPNPEFLLHSSYSFWP